LSNQGWLNYLPEFIRSKIEGRNELQKVLGNTGWLFADKIIRMGIGLLVGVWMARYLGPEQFGLLNYAGSFVTLFSAIALMGLEALIVRELVRSPLGTNELLGTAFFLRLLAGGFSFAAAMLTIYIIRPHEPITYLLVALSGGVLIFQAVDVIDLWFQSEVKSRYVVIAKCVAFLCSALLKIVLILVKTSLVAFAVANALEIALGAFGLFVVYRTNGQLISAWRVRSDKIRKLMSESLPLVLSGIVFMVYLRIDQVMLGQMVGDKEVGIYAAAVRIAEIWYFIPTVVVSSVFPNIIKARECDEEEFYKRLQKLYCLMAFMGYAVAIPVTFGAGFIVNILFGAEYAAAGPMLALLVWAGLFANLAVARNAYLFAMDWSRVLFFVTCLGAISNVALNLVLIPRFGGIGAVLASCISYWVASHGACYFYKPLRRTAHMLTRALTYPRFW
jgi:O-antigen/teichoic acid export membrane protein